MTLFCELYAMAKTCSLSMLVSADTHTRKLTVHVLPKPRPHATAEAQEAALTQPLCLTATPEEFDRDFVAALRGYRECHHSLSEQAQATCELLKAAKDASAQKAATAVSKAQRPTAKGTCASSVPSPAARHATTPTSTDDDDEGRSEGETDRTPDEADERAAQDDATGNGPTDAPNAAQPQLFG